MEDVPVLSVADKLSGNVAGVTFGSSSSNPGSVSSIRVRGMGSINAGNNPLYVIDGTPVTSGNLSEFTYSDAGTDILSSLNTNDIESITVIKDAALFTAHVLPMVLWSLRRKAENKAKQM